MTGPSTVVRQAESKTASEGCLPDPVDVDNLLTSLHEPLTMTRKVIARIVGGLGNQMFCYAAARRLALVNDADLVLDTITGFERDGFGRSYQLGAFAIDGREATRSERLEPLHRPRRAALRMLSKVLPYQRRPYIQQEGIDFDPRLLDRRIRSVVWLEGIWPSEGYFEDIAHIIRADLTLRVPPTDVANLELGERISQTASVGVHVRWFDTPGSDRNVSPDYYRAAVREILARVPNAHFFVFSDNVDSARERLQLGETASFVTHNNAEQGAIADFWLLQQCRHFIIANSTFSWWAAWLGRETSKIVICPSPEVTAAAGWATKGLVPERWLKL